MGGRSCYHPAHSFAPRARMDCRLETNLTANVRLNRYLEGELVLRRTSLPFHYQLVIKRLGEDTEEPFENEDVLEGAY